MLTAPELFDLNHTLAAPLLARFRYPWEALDGLRDFLLALGPSLPEAEYAHPAPDVWIARRASVHPSAVIAGPCIIGPGTEIRPCAFIRGSVLAGEHTVIGNSTELKNCILFDRAQAPHFNYVGDSILGFRAHLGAGAVTSNVKGDQTPVVVHGPEGPIPTGRRKLGAMVGDFGEIGCHGVLNPGTVLGRGVQVYPLCSVRGYVEPEQIWKGEGRVVPKEKR